MQKIDFKIIEQLIVYHKARKLTSKELDLLLYLSQYQENTGLIRGVYYKSVCKETGMSIQSFYAAKEALEQKKLIQVKKAYYSDYDITICNNNWSENSYRESYLNTNHNLFKSEVFKNLSVGEKLLSILLLRINLVNKGSFRIKVENFYNTYCKRLGIVKRVLQRYLNSLKPLFAIGIKDNMYYMTIYREPGSRCREAESTKLNRHTLDSACRRNRINEELVSSSNEEYNNILHLFEQYAYGIGEAIKGGMFNFSDILMHSLQIINERVKNKYKWNRRLKASLVHKCLKEALGNYTISSNL